MQHLDVLGAGRLVKIMHEFTMADQMVTNKVGRMDTGKKFKARAAIDIANWNISISGVQNIQATNCLMDYYKNRVNVLTCHFL